MNFSAWSIHRPLPSLLLFALLMGLGMWAFKNLPITDQSDLESPNVTVRVGYSGATPSQMEVEVTRKIEDAVASVANIEHITSTVSQGNSVTNIEFDLETDMRDALEQVRDAVTRIRSSLPQDITEPVVTRQTLAGRPVATYAIQSDTLGQEELSWLVDDSLGKLLRAIPGVGGVTRQGGVNREIRVHLQPDRLLAFGITAGQVSSQLRNTHAEQAGGRINLGDGEQNVRILSTVSSPEKLRSFPIALNDGRSVRLDELANVIDSNDYITTKILLDGKPAVGMQIQRVMKASELDIAQEVKATLAQFMAANSTIKITLVSTNADSVRDNYDSSMHTLYEGALLAVIVVFLFLRDWRATWIAAIALPLSIVPTFYVMTLFNLGLNSLTLLALSLVVGLLVDDAIVEVENIVRHLRDGKTPKRAALDAAQEIGLAVIGTSLTLAAIFIPVAFMPGFAGRLFKQFAIVCAVSVLFSLLVARLITPMLAAYQMRHTGHKNHEDAGPVTRRYLSMVNWSLRHRGTTLLAALALFIASIMVMKQLPGGFLNAEDTGEISITLTLPPGSGLSSSERASARMNELLRGIPEVRLVYSNIGVDRVNLLVELGPHYERERSQQEIQRAMTPLLSSIPGVRVAIGGRGFGQTLNLTLVGDDPDLLAGTAATIENEMRGIGLSGINSSTALVRNELAITPDFAKAASLGITSSALADAIRIGTSGDIDVRLPKLSLPSRQIPIRVQIDPAALTSIDAIRLLRIPARNGSVALENVADIRLSSGPAQITRLDRRRNVNISVPLNGQPLSTMLAKVQALPALKNLPAGVEQQRSGDLERQRQLTGGFQLAMIAGIFCVYGLLALLFNDLLQPITILLALPLSMTGAVTALAVGGYGLSVPSYIGLLMLMGIAVKNSILLVDYTVTAEEQGMSRHDAIVDACSKRARPIVMTSIAMGFGMLPTALDLAGGSAFRAPMGMAVLGGLFTSTILSLLVIPAAYTYVGDFEEWLRHWRRRLFAAE